MGLPHSNNTDRDGNPYDSPWDVMSSATSYSIGDPVYGWLGKHTISFHKEALGWIAPGEIFDTPSGTHTITIDQLARASTDNYRMARIPIGDDRYYTVEVRGMAESYDANLPGDVVIIYEIDPTRSGPETEPAWVIDADDPPAGFADTEGVMWRVGETFTDPDGAISVEVLSATAFGYSVRLTSGLPTVFADGFES